MRDLLTFKEMITANLSSKQIIVILNALLNAAAEPLFQHSHLMRQLVLQAMLQTQVDHRRKISIHSKENTAALIIYGITNRDFSAIKHCEIDRGTLFKAVDIVYGRLKQAVELERRLVRRPKSSKLLLRQAMLAHRLGMPVNLMTPLARWIGEYYELYLQFKERIIAKYIKFAYQEANRARALTDLHVDVGELFKNYLLALNRAIDKCDANRGTLTSYIQQWMMSARSSPEFDHQYGVAFTLPANVRKEMERRSIPLTNMSTTINETHHEIPDPDAEPLRLRPDKTLLACLRQLPHMQVPYLMLDLPVLLTPAEVNNLRGLAA